MINYLIRKFMLTIAGMSKKASKIYCIILTFVFLLAVSLLLTGLIIINPKVDYPHWAISMTIAGSIFLFVVVFTIMLTTIASNYVKRRPNLVNTKPKKGKVDSEEKK
ncbi:MAG: hypothetical protein WCR56_02750 [Bacilli bacterium]